VRLPWISREHHEAVVAVFDDAAKYFKAEMLAIKDELEREREAVKSLMATALASRGIASPYAPAGGMVPLGKPIGRKGADAILKELEAQDRKQADEKANGHADAAH
jgi:hypothetical protein